MTRETKIGLLVGLAFIIVIGILLSDHFRSTMDPPMAPLTDVSQTVRKGVTAPGTANPPIVVVTPSDAPPRQLVPTHEELTPAPRPVVPSARNGARTDGQPIAMTRDGNGLPGVPLNAGPDGSGKGSDARMDALNGVARQYGEPLERIGPNGTVNPASSDGGPAMNSYKAQAGDTVSRMAGRLLGANTRANRQAIIEINPTLRDDPDHVVVGQTYVIPTRGAAPSPVAVNTSVSPGPASPAVHGSDYYYTVQAHDSLWKVANDVLGNPGAVDAIKQLNAEVLKGKNHDVLTPGMRLRLPGN